MWMMAPPIVVGGVYIWQLIELTCKCWYYFQLHRQSVLHVPWMKCAALRPLETFRELLHLVGSTLLCVKDEYSARLQISNWHSFLHFIFLT